MNRLILFPLSLVSLFLWMGCTKDGLLNNKNSSAIIVPSTLPDLQAMLDNNVVMNIAPILPELSSDNYYLTDNYWQSAISREHNAYIWAADIFGGKGNQPDWSMPYQAVLYSNIVLEALEAVGRTSENALWWDNIKGSALYYRAFSFFGLAQTFAPPFDSTTADHDLGIPLKQSADINVIMPRGSLRATYELIIRDLRAAIGLLDNSFAGSPNRPSIAGTTALLARVFLSMRDYLRCRYYADSTLNQYDSLMDYNQLNKTTSYPFSVINEEVLFQASSTQTNVLNGVFVAECGVDSVLYSSYDSNDLRRQLFFRVRNNGICTMKGTYTGSAFPFTGIATDEVYLMRAECNVRLGNLSTATRDLNHLLLKRFKAGTYKPVQYNNAQDLLVLILKERRKELLWRGLRFLDLRRLNLEGYGITPSRTVGGNTYVLPPNSPLYVLPIPDDEIAASGIQQNKR